MKKLMVALAGMTALVASAMTYEEGSAFLSDKNWKRDLTSENVKTFLEAQVAVTNGWWINLAFDKKLITAEEAMEWWDKIPSRFTCQSYAVLAASNRVLRTAFADKLCNALKASSDAETSTLLGSNLFHLRYQAENDEERIEIANKALATGKTVYAIRTVLGNVPVNLGKKKDIRQAEFTTKYLDFANKQLPALIDAWLALSVEDTVDIWSNGEEVFLRSIIEKQIDLDSSKLAAILEKQKLLMKKFKVNLYGTVARPDLPWAVELNAYALDLDGLSDETYWEIAVVNEKITKTKTAYEKIYPKLVSESMKLKAAIYLDDADKIIDILKICSTNLTADEINSVINPLNKLDVGYRTADLKFALMNVNKKYTLKLYEDRDTWEPILSKIRAMIDVL